ncbi:MAG: hypothetical protein ACF8PN_03135 [Phycisphaerales bacterium]
MASAKQIRGLLALNAALLAALALVTMAPRANAKGEGARTAAGNYVMAGGEVNGITSNAVYVFDQNSGVLVALVFERSTKRLKGIGVRDVMTDARRLGGDR